MRTLKCVRAGCEEGGFIHVIRGDLLAILDGDAFLENAYSGDSFCSVEHLLESYSRRAEQ